MASQWRYDGRFAGNRVNCEGVPALPAWAVRWCLDDPRRIPYLLIWRSPWTEEVQEAVRVARYIPRPPFPPRDDLVEVKRTDGSVCILRFVWQELPRNGGRSLLLKCHYCGIPRRALYGWEASRQTHTVTRATWECRACAGLRYASEGGALLIRSRGWLGGLLGVGRSDRPEPWFPFVFASPLQAAELGLA